MEIDRIVVVLLRRWLMGTVVRRLHAALSGYALVGNGLDGELAQLVPRGGPN